MGKSNWSGFITYHRIKRAQTNLDKVNQQMFEDISLLHPPKLDEDYVKSCKNNNQPIDQEQ